IRTRPIEVVVDFQGSVDRAAAIQTSSVAAAPPPVTTPIVQPVTYRPGPIAAQGDLGALASAFDAASALAEIQALTGAPYLGRYPGSSGGRAAGDYIARRFAEYRLQPAGDDGTYYQSFPIEYVTLAEEPALLVRTVDGSSIRLEPYRDFSPIASQYAGAGEASGGLVWGSRCTAEDLYGVDVLDQVLLCRNGSLLDLQRAAVEHGAAGLLLLTDPVQRPPDFGATFGEAWVPEPLVALRVYPTAVETMLAGSGYSVDDLSTSFLPLPLGAQIEARVSTVGAEACPATGCRGRNVLGVLPGRDPAHRDEVVMLGAHYDHLGEAPGGTSWVGANDDASGVAVLLEIARTWAAQGYVPRRTVLFAAWDAEEMGLLGSRYYVDHPRYPLDDTLGMLQFDMVGTGGERLQLDGDPAMVARLQAVAEARSVDTFLTRDGRSDHVPFWEAGVPSGMLIWDIGSQAGAQPTYHRPADTAETIESEKLEAAGEIGGIALLGLAEGEPGIDDLLASRAAAVEAGDVAAFLDTSVSAQQQDDGYWYADLASLSPTSVQMTARDIHVTGTDAVASVQIAVTCADESGECERTLTTNIDERYQH
ncbi:MAG: M20/M25/M40 family metallo-hydrolase, partial [Anaerolineae bacterium]